MSTLIFTPPHSFASLQVIANEYGLEPLSRLSIGSKICKELVGKLLCDMANMREESLVTCCPEDDGKMPHI